jgi:hypothetical protein
MNRRTRNGASSHSFANGNGPGAIEDQWSGTPLRPVHWWHWS